MRNSTPSPTAPGYHLLGVSGSPLHFYLVTFRRGWQRGERLAPGLRGQKAFWALIGRREMAGISSSGAQSGAGSPVIPYPSPRKAVAELEFRARACSCARWRFQNVHFSELAHSRTGCPDGHS